MEKQYIARLHLHMDEGEAFENFGNAVQVGARLVSGESVIDAAKFVRTFDHLEAPVLFCCAVDAMKALQSNGRRTPFWYQ